MTITRARILAWLQQPTTIAGIAALVGDGIVVVTGAATWRVELPIAAGSLIAMALPDNTAAAGLLVRTLHDVLAAVASRDPAMILAAVADAEALLGSLDPSPVSPPAPAVREPSMA
jgi:hypothetical protein